MSERLFHLNWHLFRCLFSRSHKRILEANMAEKRLARPISRRTLLRRSSMGTLVAAPASAWSLAWISQRFASATPARAVDAARSSNVCLIAPQLDAQICAVCPNIDGVWIGNPQDKSTWGIWFQPSATSAQKVAAHIVLRNFVLDRE